MPDSCAMSVEPLRAGLYETLVTRRLKRLLGELGDDSLDAELAALADAEASDRVSRHVALLLARVIEAFPEQDRAEAGWRLAGAVLRLLDDLAGPDVGLSEEVLAEPTQVLHAILRRQPDGTREELERPLTPLLDTTVLTNAPGEPAVGHELRAEIHSADSIDLVMAFVRWSGVRPMMQVLRRHTAAGKRVRVLTTTYTNSTERRALAELDELGAQIRVSYDTPLTRLHAKAWIFRRSGGYSTAYLGSSNLTHSGQVTGLEWNVRLSEVRNPDAIAKMSAVFSSYWEHPEFVPYDSAEFADRTETPELAPSLVLSPVEIELRPFQDVLLEKLALARQRGQHRNLLVAATGTGKTVMAAVDYQRLRKTVPRARLLFVAHREEILDQSHNTFRHALRDPSFGEKWVGGERPSRFDHVFASIQSLSNANLEHLDPQHFDVVIVDEFHHAAAQSYERLLGHLEPPELLGLTATPERADGLDVLQHFDGRITAELRLWDAIDQQHLVPFAYFGMHDGLDLSEVPWRRGAATTFAALTNILTADHVWASRVLEQVRRKIADPGRMRALGFCVSVAHARFMAARFNAAGLPAVAIWSDSPWEERQRALKDLMAGSVCALFTVDLFNEGVDLPTVDTLLLLRPTESPTLFLQQLGRGLRKAPDKDICTVLDFVGTHRKEFRYDRRFRALLGGSRGEVERQIEEDFPFLPAGCHLELDPVAQDVILRSIRNSVPSRWQERFGELKALGDVPLAEFLEHTGLELEDIYANNRSWSELRRAAGLSTAARGTDEDALLRGVGRLLHIDDEERIAAYRELIEQPIHPSPHNVGERSRRLLRMLVSSLAPRRSSSSLEEVVRDIWQHPQVRAEILELLDLLPDRIDHLQPELGLDPAIPLRIHARYTRAEILSAFDVGDGATPTTWQAGVWWCEPADTDLFAFTLDKSHGGFSPTTRYRDYAISRELIHWESQSATSIASDAGQRYIHQGARDQRRSLREAAHRRAGILVPRLRRPCQP